MDYDHIDVKRITPNIGAEVCNVDLGNIDDGAATDIRAALIDRKAKRRYTEEQFNAMLEAEPIRHPLVCLNPQNGRKYLFVNMPIYCRSIVGMENEEGDRLLRQLYRHAQRPEFQLRLVWQINTLVVWENSHCLHYPVADYFPQARKLWRVAMTGVDRPVAA